MTESFGRMDVEAARAAGVVTEQPVFQNYWGFVDRKKHMLPDGVQYLVLQRMSEGDKARYQRETRSDITVSRNTGDARMKADPAAERHALIKACVKDWNMLDPDRNPIPFSVSSGQYNLEKWLSVADPKLVEDLEKACRKHNPWLLSDMSSEDIRREIDNLKEMLEEAEKREAGE